MKTREMVLLWVSGLLWILLVTLPLNVTPNPLRYNQTKTSNIVNRYYSFTCLSPRTLFWDEIFLERLLHGYRFNLSSPVTLPSLRCNPFTVHQWSTFLQDLKKSIRTLYCNDLRRLSETKLTHPMYLNHMDGYLSLGVFSHLSKTLFTHFVRLPRTCIITLKETNPQLEHLLEFCFASTQPQNDALKKALPYFFTLMRHAPSLSLMSLLEFRLLKLSLPTFEKLQTNFTIAFHSNVPEQIWYETTEHQFKKVALFYHRFQTKLTQTYDEFKTNPETKFLVPHFPHVQAKNLRKLKSMLMPGFFISSNGKGIYFTSVYGSLSMHAYSYISCSLDPNHEKVYVEKHFRFLSVIPECP